MHEPPKEAQKPFALNPEAKTLQPARRQVLKTDRPKNPKSKP